jgi:hypothetical protein
MRKTHEIRQSLDNETDTVDCANAAGMGQLTTASKAKKVA